MRNSITIILAATMLQACAVVAPAAKVLGGAVVGLQADRAINGMANGTQGGTISGDTGKARDAGSKTAALACKAYDLNPILRLYDVGHFPLVYGSEAEKAGIPDMDHCGRWAWEADQQVKNPPVVTFPQSTRKW